MLLLAFEILAARPLQSKQETRRLSCGQWEWALKMLTVPVTDLLLLSSSEPLLKMPELETLQSKLLLWS